ncbi:aldehyde dehydrogenase family protein [Blastococcus capsensis]|uniref:aldehyde dehydrogenase family protein n=1 Tax=Blastococcus capsensis TaxID=1564163 RepID=UPI002541F527|nr:aldehyde dehydrogenase family protein [Blastococcus capsensis]
MPAVQDDVDVVLHRAQQAQQAFRRTSEREVDLLLEALAEVVVRHASDLADQTVTESGMGCAADKRQKNLFAAQDVLRSLRGRTGCGLLESRGVPGVIEIARPVGVVLGLMPLTNPVATLAFLTLIALKSRNALVVRAHPRAARVTERAAALLREALLDHGAAQDLLNAIPPVDREQVRALVRHPCVDLVVATGSTGLVAAAGASGKPTLGAGAGNAPAWICEDASVERATRMVVDSKSFDHGIICGSEQHLLVDSSILRAVTAGLRGAGAAVLSAAEVDRLEAALFVDGRMRIELAGKSPTLLAQRAGIAVGPQVRLLVVPLSRDRAAGPWGLERLAPVLTIHEVPGEKAALALCAWLLGRGGAGHTAAIHTRSRARAVRFAEAVPVSRVILNGPASQGCIGLGNGLTPSLALGCGVAGGAVTTDNLTYRHLFQVTRIATPVSPPSPRPRPDFGAQHGADADGRPSAWSGERDALRDPVPAGG